MQELVHRFLGHGLSRRGLMKKLTGLGLGLAAAQAVIEPLEALEEAGKGLPVAGARTATGTGGELVMEQAKAAGAEYLFTNPGSFEVGLLDAQPSSGVPAIVSLHEGLVIATADGYARMSGKTAFVNIHISAGTAQALGQLYNASRDSSPMVVTAGLLDNEIWSDDVSLAPRPGYDQKEITRQFTKFSSECREPRALALATRRAFKTATTEPGGPVYVAMANYALEAKNITSEILPGERFMFRPNVRPETAAVEQTAKWLIAAKRPVIVVGDECWKCGASAAVVAFAEKFGVPVATGQAGFKPFPSRHPLHLNGFNLGSDYMKPGVDLIIMVGARDPGGRTVPGSPEMPTAAHVVRIGLDTTAMSRNYATDIAMIAHPKEALKDLTAALDGMLTKERIQKFGVERANEVKGITKKMWDSYDAARRKNFGQSLMHPDELTHIMAQNLEKNSVIVQEVHDGGPHVDAFNFGIKEDEMMWLSYTSNGLGWGVGSAAGVQLAAPNRPTVLSIGDGAVMYGSSGFWTMARYSIPVLTVVWNNKNYQTVRMAYSRYGGKMAATGQYVGMYLGDPDLDFVKLGESQGVKGEKCKGQTEFTAALKRGVQATKNGNPYIIDVDIARIGPGAESTWHEGFKLTSKRTGARRA